MSSVSDYEAVIACVALHTGTPVQLVRRILDPHLRRCSRSYRLQSFLEFYEALARLEHQEGQSGIDPILRMWRIWIEKRKSSLPCPDLEHTPIEGGIAHQAMASRLCFYWDGHPQEHQVHRSLHAQVSRKRSGSQSVMEQEATSWRRWYAMHCELHERSRRQDHRGSARDEGRR